jgi:hypothetical protein
MHRDPPVSDLAFRVPYSIGVSTGAKRSHGIWWVVGERFTRLGPATMHYGPYDQVALDGYVPL